MNINNFHQLNIYQIVILLIVYMTSCSTNSEQLEKKNGLKYYSDSNRLFSGSVKGKHPSGAIKSKGHYLNGKKDGFWTEWNKRGFKWRETIWKNGESIKITTWDYYDNGNKKEKVSHKDGVRFGEFSNWFENRIKKSEETYEDGERNGLCITWDIEGNKITEIIYKDGKRNGIASWWDSKGQKTSEGTYIDGIKNGVFTHWYPNGNLKQIGTFKNGHRDGLRFYWNENGGREGKWNYKDGVKDGESILWYKNGQKKLEILYKDGEVNLKKEWGQDGAILN